MLKLILLLVFEVAVVVWAAAAPGILSGLALLLGGVAIYRFVTARGSIHDPALPQTRQFQDTTIEDTVVELAELLSRARDSILIVTGLMDPRVYADERIVNALTKAMSDRQVKVEVIVNDFVVGPKNNPLRTFMVTNPDRFKANHYRGNVGNHFAVIDSVHVRLEKVHEPNVRNFDARVEMNSPDVVRVMEGRFERLLLSSFPLGIEDLKEKQEEA